MVARADMPHSQKSLFAAGFLSIIIALPATGVLTRQASAQEAGTPTVIINMGVLERLGPEQSLQGSPGAPVLKSGSLLAPPQTAPKSRLVGQYADQNPAPPLEPEAAPKVSAEAADGGNATDIAAADETTRDAGAGGTEEPLPSQVALEEDDTAAREAAGPTEAEAVTAEKRGDEVEAAGTETIVEEVPAEDPGPAQERDLQTAEETPSSLSLVATAEAAETPKAETDGGQEAAGRAPEPRTPKPQTPKALPEVPAAPGETQTAAVAPRETIDLDAQVLFAAGSAELTPRDEQALLTVAEQLKAVPELRVQLQAFAAKRDDSANSARRLSLSRALVVRDFLVAQGIATARIQVRALGEGTGEGGPPDRVAIKPQGG